jgi:hypothetical protein
MNAPAIPLGLAHTAAAALLSGALASRCAPYGPLALVMSSFCMQHQVIKDLYDTIPLGLAHTAAAAWLSGALASRCARSTWQLRKHDYLCDDRTLTTDDTLSQGYGVIPDRLLTMFNTLSRIVAGVCLMVLPRTSVRRWCAFSPPDP